MITAQRKFPNRHCLWNFGSCSATLNFFLMYSSFYHNFNFSSCKQLIIQYLCGIWFLYDKNCGRSAQTKLYDIFVTVGAIKNCKKLICSSIPIFTRDLLTQLLYKEWSLHDQDFLYYDQTSLYVILEAADLQ